MKHIPLFIYCDECGIHPATKDWLRDYDNGLTHINIDGRIIEKIDDLPLLARIGVMLSQCEYLPKNISRFMEI